MMILPGTDEVSGQLTGTASDLLMASWLMSQWSRWGGGDVRPARGGRGPHPRWCEGRDGTGSGGAASRAVRLSVPLCGSPHCAGAAAALATPPGPPAAPCSCAPASWSWPAAPVVPAAASPPRRRWAHWASSSRVAEASGRWPTRPCWSSRWTRHRGRIAGADQAGAVQPGELRDRRRAAGPASRERRASAHRLVSYTPAGRWPMLSLGEGRLWEDPAKREWVEDGPGDCPATPPGCPRCPACSTTGTSRSWPGGRPRAGRAAGGRPA